jgi:hypothetical protein
MNIQTTKSRIITLVQETESEFLLTEICKILELDSGNSFELTDEEMNELEVIEKNHDTSKLQTASWLQIRERLLSKLQK